MGKDGLSKKVGYGLLAAFYAPLLTDRQQTLIELYCDEDLSLSEIANQLSISRQAVSDNLNRAYDHMDELEERLEMYRGYLKMRKEAAFCYALLEKVKASPDTDCYLEEAMALLHDSIVQKGNEDGI